MTVVFSKFNLYTISLLGFDHASWAWLDLKFQIAILLQIIKFMQKLSKFVYQKELYVASSAFLVYVNSQVSL